MMINGMSMKRSFTSEVFQDRKLSSFERIRVLVLLQHTTKSKEIYTSNFGKWIKLLLLTNYHLPHFLGKNPTYLVIPVKSCYLLMIPKR